MKWFFNLKRAFRVLIAVLAWLPLIVASVLMSGAIGDNGENMQWWQALLILVFLAVPIVFDVFAIVARKREKSAENATNSTPPPPEFSTSQISPAVTPISASHDNVTTPSAERSERRKNPPLPTYNASVKLTVFENRIKGVNLAVGDDCIIKFENDDVMQSSNGKPIINANCYRGDVKVGLFPYCKSLRTINGKVDYPCKIASIDEKDGKTVIYINIDLPFMIDAKLPLSVTLSGTSFENRRDIIQNSRVGDYLRLTHEPTAEYPNVIKVYDIAADGCIGVVPKDTDEKLIKKYKIGCEFYGVITSIFGGGGNKNYGVDIMIVATK